MLRNAKTKKNLRKTVCAIQLGRRPGQLLCFGRILPFPPSWPIWADAAPRSNRVSCDGEGSGAMKDGGDHGAFNFILFYFLQPFSASMSVVFLSNAEPMAPFSSPEQEGPL